MTPVSGHAVWPVDTNLRPGEPADRAADLERAAIDFEAVFLSEMLRHAGLGQAREAFGGGAGEEVFSSLLTQQWATSLAENGGIGLAEHLLRSLQPYGGGDFGED